LDQEESSGRIATTPCGEFSSGTCARRDALAQLRRRHHECRMWAEPAGACRRTDAPVVGSERRAVSHCVQVPTGALVHSARAVEHQLASSFAGARIQEINRCSRDCGTCGGQAQGCGDLGSLSPRCKHLGTSSSQEKTSCTKASQQEGVLFPEFATNAAARRR